MGSETAASEHHAALAQPATASATAASAALSGDWLSTVTYRSRTVLPMSELDLYRLLKSAQARNREEGVTGVMVYDSGWVYQQLEGPAAGLGRIWSSIQRDPRHQGIEVLGDAEVRERRYADWDLKLSVHGATAGEVSPGASEPPPELISRLYRGEQQAHALPAGWLESVPVPAHVRAVAEQDAAVRRALLSVFLRTVLVPQLLTAHPAAADDALSTARAVALARLLIGPETDEAFALVEAAHASHGSLSWLALQVVEPAARGLGDLWQSDDCSEGDVTLGLVRLQSFVRRLGVAAPRFSSLCEPVVLIVPQPGEVHMLGAALDAEVLWHAGWNPRVEFPASSDALDSLVANTWVDALDLSMSTAFRREHRLGQLTETIARARVASLNPDLVVIVGGRAFGTSADPSDTTHAVEATPCTEVGADAGYDSASLAEAALRRALNLDTAG